MECWFSSVLLLIPQSNLGVDPSLVVEGEEDSLMILLKLYVESSKLSRKALCLTRVVRLPTRLSTSQLEAWSLYLRSFSAWIVQIDLHRPPK